MNLQNMETLRLVRLIEEKEREIEWLTYQLKHQKEVAAYNKLPIESRNELDLEERKLLEKFGSYSHGGTKCKKRKHKQSRRRRYS